MAEVINPNTAALLAQKNQAKLLAVQSADPIRNRIDERGRVKIWLIGEARWVSVWPVDAMDILKSGTANLDGPVPDADPQVSTEPEPESELAAPAESPKPNKPARKPK